MVTTTKTQAAAENWTGKSFANGWVIDKKLSCAEYRKIYVEQTGDTSKQIKNAHYLCHNTNCGVSTYIERTVIKRAMDASRDCLSKCKGCDGAREKCHYAIQCREKNLTKTPDRSAKIQVGDIHGVWKVLELFSSGNDADHQMKARCKCQVCGEEKILRVNHIINHEAACECFKQHSCGEFLIKQYLEKQYINFKTEYIFDNLVGTGGGNLRYDFAIFDNANKLIALIEFDGQQHFQEAGTYYNPNGTVQVHDAIKDEFAKEKNIPLLRIPYTEILHIESIIVAFFMENEILQFDFLKNF